MCGVAMLVPCREAPSRGRCGQGRASVAWRPATHAAALATDSCQRSVLDGGNREQRDHLDGGRGLARVL